MHLLEELDSELIKRLVKQTSFLRRVHQTELAKCPTSRATKSSRSNLMAALHTVRQIYGEGIAQGVSNLVTSP